MKLFIVIASALVGVGTSSALDNGSDEVSSPQVTTAFLRSAVEAGTATVSFENLVNCINGQAYDSTGTTATGRSCREECNNGSDCCGGDEGRKSWSAGACDYFTGKVARDGSCMGISACADVGKQGSVGVISGASCVGFYACKGAGSGMTGKVGNISGGSCIGEYACNNAGRYGKIGNLSGCCKADSACQQMGYMRGDTGDLSDCCNAPASCANKEGSVAADACAAATHHQDLAM